jgi:hypothetical protein
MLVRQFTPMVGAWALAMREIEATAAKAPARSATCRLSIANPSAAVVVAMSDEWGERPGANRPRFSLSLGIGAARARTFGKLCQSGGDCRS